MRLLLLSDSHGADHFIEELKVEVLREGRPDAILFAGDGIRDLYKLSSIAPIHAVRGNCDPADPMFPQALILTFNGHRIHLSHGNLHRVKHSTDALALAAQEAKADIAVYGHTHCPDIARCSGVLCVNPGALKNGEYALLHLKEGQKPRPECRILR